MKKKYITLSALALLNIVIVGNLQVLPSNATYGSLLPFLYLCAIIGFFLPTVLMVAELATSRPQTGGAYIWCEKAFGPKVGFFVVCIITALTYHRFLRKSSVFCWRRIEAKR